MKNKKQILVLEPSSNTHTVSSPNKIEVIKKYPNGDKMFNVKKAVVVHGEHGSFGIEGVCYKVTQQEFNPVTKAINNAWD